MANKGLMIGVAALVAVGAMILFFGKQPSAPQQDLTETAASLEAVTPVAPAPTEAAPATETAATDAGATPEAAEAPAEEGKIVAAPVETAEAETAPAPAAGEEGSLLETPPGLEIDVNKVMEDRAIGNPQAPVVIIEYASMTCPHCAHFHKTIFPEVKARLIETGKVLFIFREFPLDGTATKASMMARCADPAKFFDLIEVIFHNQDRWIKADDPIKALTQYAVLAGMDDTQVNLCVNNAELENALLGKINEAQKRYSLVQTPTFIFNGGEEKFSGAKTIEEFEAAVAKLSAGK